MGEEYLLRGEALDVLQTMGDAFVDVSVSAPMFNRAPEYTDDYQQGQIDVLNQVYRLMKPGGSFFYHHSGYWLNDYLHHPIDWIRQTDWMFRQDIVWDRGKVVDRKQDCFWQVDERIYWLYKPLDDAGALSKLLNVDARKLSVWRSEEDDLKLTSLPIWLPARLIVSILGMGDGDSVVLDPYLGSGSTAVAAKLLGYSYIGIEHNEALLKEACARLKDADAEAPAVFRELGVEFL